MKLVRGLTEMYVRQLRFVGGQREREREREEVANGTEWKRSGGGWQNSVLGRVWEGVP